MGARTGTYPEELTEVVSLENDDTILIVRGNNIFTASASILATGGITVENVLTSDSVTNALSAAQGKALNTALSSKAALVSPAFTGNPTAPTAAAETDNTEIATTAFVHDITDTIITSLGDKCPLVDGKVPSVNLPSYVDDALEFANLAAFPVTGESGKIYIAINDNTIYRWTGSAYVLIGDGTSVDVIGVGAAAFVRYDAAQTLTTPEKTQAKTNIGLGDSDGLTEGTTNLFFTAARAVGSLLTMYAEAGTNAVVAATDSVLLAIGKLQKQITDLSTSAVTLANNRYSFKDEIGVSYVVVTADITPLGTVIVTCTNAGAIAVTVGEPQDYAGVVTGDSFNIRQGGAGAITISAVAASGALFVGNLTTSAAHTTLTLIAKNASTWMVVGG